MSELHRLYDKLREAGKGHAAAILELARHLDVDEATVRRVLTRAQAEHRAASRRRAA